MKYSTLLVISILLCSACCHTPPPAPSPPPCNRETLEMENRNLAAEVEKQNREIAAYEEKLRAAKTETAYLDRWKASFKQLREQFDEALSSDEEEPVPGSEISYKMDLLNGTLVLTFSNKSFLRRESPL